MDMMREQGGDPRSGGVADPCVRRTRTFTFAGAKIH